MHLWIVWHNAQWAENLKVKNSFVAPVGRVIFIGSFELRCTNQQRVSIETLEKSFEGGATISLKKMPRYRSPEGKRQMLFGLFVPCLLTGALFSTVSPNKEMTGKHWLPEFVACFR